MRPVIFAFACTALILSGCTEMQFASHVAKNAGTTKTPPTQGTFKVGNPYKIDNRWYYPQEEYDLVETGIASWYGPGFHGKSTANGETFDKNELTAAHRTLQMPSLVRVTTLDNGRSLVVRVNDRGPYKRGRVIDVSEKAAELLGFKNNGTAKVKLQVLREESLRVAEAAKKGENTRGYEIAANQRKGLMPGGQVHPEGSYQIASLADTPPPYQQAPQTTAVKPVQREALAITEQTDIRTSVPGHSRGGKFYPDPVVSNYPVTSNRIYIQAGAFSTHENALRLSDQLGSYYRAGIYPAEINGKSLYRVRLGPIENVAQADQLINRLATGGHKDAMIVVE